MNPRLCCSALSLASLAFACKAEAPLSPEPRRDVMTASVAAAVEDPFTALITVTGVIDPGESWVSGGGTFHSRGLVLTYDMSGDIEGSGTLTQSVNVNAKGVGMTAGPFQQTATWRGIAGTISGQFAGHVADGIETSTFVAQGHGDLEGMTFQFRFSGPVPAGPFAVTGRVISHGP
ncbi:MAG: hypothetical protein DMD29_01340 [Gemmatimonadetes bacterium]|nr:MAG: hypothetical protein DMD29_01340 [Gemmatimonadota bacterium]